MELKEQTNTEVNEADSEMTPVLDTEVIAETDTQTDIVEESNQQEKKGWFRKKTGEGTDSEELTDDETPELQPKMKKLRKKHYREGKAQQESGMKPSRSIRKRFESNFFGFWLKKNWRPILILLVIFLLALTIRSYYGLEPATEDGFILSGGSDSYYHHWVIRYAEDTGELRFRDEMLNYPIGSRNPRPPLYDWSVYLGGIGLSPFFGLDVDISTWYVFLFSTAFWGAMTIFPTFFLAKEAFGRKTGYIAAFLLAIMPGHIQRSVLTNADHDAFALFFIVTAFYFFLRALKLLKEKVWVDSWLSASSIGSGISSFIRENSRSVIYAMMAGVSIASVGLIWKGYSYVIVILVVYLLIQLLIDRFRNALSLGVLMVFIFSVGTAMLIMYPYYLQSEQIPSWYDTPLIMFFGAVAIGTVLVVTNRLPWIMVIFGFVILALVALLVLSIVAPTVLDSILNAVASGAGYFIRNKQFETIAEAQAPPFGNLALSFGVMTFWLSLVGVGWAIYQLPKRIKFDYIFVIIWTATSIFMAISAARFMFNAAPVFAVTAAWIVAMLVDRLKFKEFVEHQRRIVHMRITRGFTLSLIGSFALIVIVVAGMSTVSELALPVLVIGISAIVSAILMNQISEVNPKRIYHMIAILVPITGALFYLYVVFVKGWVLTGATHGFMLFIMLLFDFLILLTVRKTRISFTVGVLFLTFFIITPNIWAAMDAGMPYEVKREHDGEIYEVMPLFLQPDNSLYQNQSPWYLGAFGYSLPLNSKYYPAAYDWLATQDTDIYPWHDRPAYLSWWDYGFEAINEGEHPTVADNFLAGHQLAGNFIMAQSESDAIALLITRLIEADWVRNPTYANVRLSDGMRDLLDSYALDVPYIEEICASPEDYIETVKAHPEIYGPRDDVVQPLNARYLMIRGLISENLNLEEIVSLYHDIRELTGHSIRYFAIDSRLFPFNSQNTGIFYAPAKLSDHRMSEIGNQPYDFFEIKAVGEFGGVYNLTDIPNDVNLDPQNPYKIVYKDMFYKTMLYKCFMGYSAEDLGQTNDDGGIPGLSESVKDNQIMPGWNMKHWKLVHRTAYWNPHSADEIRNHTDAWRAMNFWDAYEKQQAGDGISDLSDRSSIGQGVMMLKYYDGAIVSGTIELEDGTPLHGARVTVHDEFGIPHDMTITDASGQYSIIVPFGNISLVTSVGEVQPQNLIGTQLNVTKLFIEDYQAMREKEDRNGDGKWDYLIANNVVISSGGINGTAFWDMDGDGTYNNENDELISGAEVNISSNVFNASSSDLTDENGTVSYPIFPPGEAAVRITYAGRSLLTLNTTITSEESLNEEWAITPTNLTGVVYDSFGAPASEGMVEIWIDDEDPILTPILENGTYAFDNLLYGEYKIRAIGLGQASNVEIINILHLNNNTVDLRMVDTVVFSGQVTYVQDTPAVGANIRLISDDSTIPNVMIQADMEGSFREYIPEAEYNVYINHPMNGIDYVHLSTLELSGDTTIELRLEQGARVHGSVKRLDTNTFVFNASIAFRSIISDSQIVSISDFGGTYVAHLPYGTYDVYASTQGGTNEQVSAFPQGDTDELVYASTLTINTPTLAMNPYLDAAVSVQSTVYYDFDQNGQYEPHEGLPGVKINYDSGNGKIISTTTDVTGLSTIKLYESNDYEVTISNTGFETGNLGTYSAKALSAQNNLYAIEPVLRQVSGFIMLDGSPLLDQNAFVEFHAEGGGAVSQDVQMNLDGSYNANLRPGTYIIDINKNITPDNDSAVIQIVNPIEFDTESSLSIALDIPVKERVKFRMIITKDSVPSEANLSFMGPEFWDTTVIGGSTELYIKPGEYNIRASFANDTDIHLASEFVNISALTSISMDMKESYQLEGALEFEIDTSSNEVVTFIDSMTNDTIIVHTAQDGTYSVKLVPERKYLIEVDFIMTDLNGRVYRYHINESLTDPSGNKLNEITTTVGGSSTKNIVLEKELYKSKYNGNVGTGSGSAPNSLMRFISKFEDHTTETDEFGNFETELPPGNYHLYIHHPDTHMTYLGLVDIRVEESTANYTLVTGYQLYGEVFYNQNSHQITELDFTSEDGSLNLTTDQFGYYSIWLPSNEYSVSGMLTALEYGIDVTYDLSTELILNKNSRTNLPLSKVENLDVDVQWEAIGTDVASPSETVRYLITVMNTGNLVDTYEIAGDTEPGWEFDFNETKLTIGYGSVANSKSVIVDVTASEGALVQHNPINIKATSVKDTNVSKLVTLTFNVAQTYDLEIEQPMKSAVLEGITMTWPFNLKNPGNGQDKYTVYLANTDELRNNGWDVTFENATGLEVNENGDKIVNVTIGGRASKEIQMNLVQIRDNPFKMARILIGAYSQTDTSLFASEYFIITYPEILLEDSNLTISGDIVSDGPTEHPAMGATITMIAVVIALVLFYTMKKKRWLR